MTESGLFGVSGISDDMRTLLASDDPSAKEAVALFVYRIGRELGSLAAALGGIDALVFTAGIGEHAAEIRRRVCEQAAWLGVDLDPSANLAGGAMITRRGSRTSAWVIPTDEDLMIARHAWTPDQERRDGKGLITRCELRTCMRRGKAIANVFPTLPVRRVSLSSRSMSGRKLALRFAPLFHPEHQDQSCLKSHPLNPLIYRY